MKCNGNCSKTNAFSDTSSLFTMEIKLEELKKKKKKKLCLFHKKFEGK